jgi:hypothetical protein
MAKPKIPAGFVSANVSLKFWKPTEPGESISGWYQGMRHVEARDNFPPQDVYDLADENGELISLGGASLLRQFARINEGDRVQIVFNGRKKSKPGRADFKDLEVFVKGELKPFKRND